MEKRKSYTLSKEREVWTLEEHAKFLDCLERFGRDWKRAEAVICTKNVLQIRSHAQKYFMKLRRPAATAPPAGTEGWAAANAPVDAAPAAGKTLLRTARRTTRVSSDAETAAAGAATTSSTTASSGDTGATTAEMQSLGPALLTAARFEEWMGENNLLPPHEGFAQFAEAQQRLLEQLRTAQEFLQHVMGYTSGGVGSVGSTSSAGGASASSSAGTASAPSTSTASPPTVDYLRVYTFLCVALESSANDAALQARLQQLRPLEQDVAVLLLHQLVVTRVARRLRAQFDAHAARVLADIQNASVSDSTNPTATETATTQTFSSPYNAAQGDGV